MSNHYAVIFDMDGVLIDSEYYYLKFNQRFLEDKGVKVEEEMLYDVVGTPIQQTYEMLYSFLKDRISFDKMVEEYQWFWENIKVDYGPLLNPTVRETLDYLQENGFKIALASSCDMPGIQKVLDDCDLRKYFSVVLSGDQFHMSKPDPEIYVTVAKLLDIPCDRCFVIEDSVYGIEAGKRAGMKVIAYKQRFGHDQSRADFFIDQIYDTIAIIVDNID